MSTGSGKAGAGLPKPPKDVRELDIDGTLMRGVSFGQPKSIALGCGTIGGKGGGITTIIGGDLGRESMLLSVNDVDVWAVNGAVGRGNGMLRSIGLEKCRKSG